MRRSDNDRREDCHKMTQINNKVIFSTAKVFFFKNENKIKTNEEKLEAFTF